MSGDNWPIMSSFQMCVPAKDASSKVSSTGSVVKREVGREGGKETLLGNRSSNITTSYRCAAPTAPARNVPSSDRNCGSGGCESHRTCVATLTIKP